MPPASPFPPSSTALAVFLYSGLTKTSTDYSGLTKTSTAYSGLTKTSTARRGNAVLV
ncbi:hypothetical protein [Neisseria meningitidis]|uniref:hypothetical protein n=1 Tax=Neisseria meningitidis TaxID=487 RepID=UPI00163E10BF|nr:hypothetical protein [Neisseria meningitidis]